MDNRGAVRGKKDRKTSGALDVRDPQRGFNGDSEGKSSTDIHASASTHNRRLLLTDNLLGGGS